MPILARGECRAVLSTAQPGHDPRSPALAAGDKSFGLVWVDNRSGQSEVCSQWVGCL